MGRGNFHGVPDRKIIVFKYKMEPAYHLYDIAEICFGTKQFDASEYGGAPLLGISKPVIKAHGSSDAKAVKNAIFQAITFLSTGINRDIADAAERMAVKEQETGAKNGEGTT